MKKTFILFAWWFLAMDFYWVLHSVGPFLDEKDCEKQRKWAQIERNSKQIVGDKCFRY